MKVLIEDDSGFFPRASIDVARVTKPKMKQNPSLHDKQQIFDLAQQGTNVDELFNKLQMYNFDVNKESNDSGDYLIHIATKQGLCHLAVLSLLMKECNANIDLTNNNGFTCLMLASIMGNATIVNTILCVLGADPDIRNPKTGRTALHYASQRNDIEVVSVLINRGANYNIEDFDRARPDELATIFHAHDCSKMILLSREQHTKELVSLVEKDALRSEDIHHTDLFTTDVDGDTLLMVASRLNSCCTLQWLAAEPESPIDAQHPKSLMTALAFACRSGHVEAIRILIENGSSPSVRDIDGNIPLDHAVMCHQVAAVTELLQYPQALTGLYQARTMSKHPVIQKELQQAILRRQNHVVMPVLFECCVSGDSDKLYSILEVGDDINITIGLGDWPLYLSVENGHLNLTELLYQFLGDVNRVHPQSGNSIFHAACAQGHLEVARFILNKCNRCKNNNKTKQKQHPGQGMINAFNFHKETPIILAANKGYGDLVDLLLSEGASSSILDPGSGQIYTSSYERIQHTLELHRKKHTLAIMTAISDWKAVSHLQEIFFPQFDHNLRNEKGDTPLMQACWLGKTDVVKFLLQSAIVEDLPARSSSLTISCDYDKDSGAVIDAILRTSCKSLHSNGFAAVPSIEHTPSSTFFIPSNTEEDEELAVNDNISSLLDSIDYVSKGCVYASYRQVNHLCAVNHRDGATVYHRTIQGGDNVAILDALLQIDQSAVNIQDLRGLSPLHLACKLGRKKIITKLISAPFVDLNCRTLDGKLPEEMTANKSLISLVVKSRKHQPIRGRFPSLSLLSSSIFGILTPDEDSNSVDFDAMNSRFMLLRNDAASDISMFM